MLRIGEQLVRRQKHIYLCSNAVLLERSLPKLPISDRLTLSVHLDGLAPTHDRLLGRPGLFNTAIQAIKAAPAADAELIRQAIRTGGLDHLDEIIAIVQRCGALEYTRQRARQESDLALAALAVLPDSPYKAALADLTRLALQRDC